MKKFKLGINMALMAAIAFSSCKKGENLAAQNEAAQSANAKATNAVHTYYVSANGTGNGLSESSPFNLAAFKAITLVAGDVVRFQRGSVFNVPSSGFIFTVPTVASAANPVLISTYGSAAAAPTFTNNQNRFASGINITGDYITIENLLFYKCAGDAVTIATGADHNTVRNCEVNDCGRGVLVNGQYNLLTGNNIHDLHMIINDVTPAGQQANDYGAVAFWLYSPNNTISYNTVTNAIADSYDFTTDGGFLELYTDNDNTYIHHNVVTNSNDILETSSGHGNNIRIIYNRFIEANQAFAFKTSYTAPGFIFDNNTYVDKTGTLFDGVLTSDPNPLPTGLTLRNNIFVYGGDGASGKISKAGSNFVHTNNLYYLLNGAQLGYTKNPSEITADPLFFNESSNDFTLKGTSPAKGTGIDLNYMKDLAGVDVQSPPNIGAYDFRRP